MPRFRSNDPWRILWRIFTSDYLLGSVLLALALSLVLAAWLPQMSAGGSALGAEDAAWQAEIQRRFGGIAWFDVIRSALQAVGAFYVADAAWFRLLLALLTLSLLARLINSAERLWQRRQGSAPPQGASWMTVDGSLEELVGRLRRQRLRVVNEGDGGNGKEQTDGFVRVDRWPWEELGPILVYLGGLMLFLGMAVTALWGWRVGPLPVAVGESVSLGHRSDLTLRLDELTQDGRRGVGKIWHEGDTLAGAGDLAVGRPLAGGGVGAYLVGGGAGLRVKATLSDTQTLKFAVGPGRELQENLLLAFTEDEPRHLVGVPETDLVLLFSMPQPAQRGAPTRVQAFESGSGQLILEQDVSGETALTIEDVSFVIMQASFAEIRVVYDPGAFWSQLGVLGLITGALLRGLWPPRHLWLRRQASSAKSPDGLEATGNEDLLIALGALGDEV